MAPRSSKNLDRGPMGSQANTLDTQEAITRRGRGSTRGLGTDKIIAKSKKKLEIEFDKELCTYKGVGANGSAWENEIGWIARNMAPMQIKKWKEVSAGKLKNMIDRLRVKFVWDETNEDNDKVLDSIDRSLNEKWADFRYRLHTYFKNKGGLKDLEGVKKLKHPQVSRQADWNYFCDYVSTQEFQERSEINKINRAKKKYHSRQGSKSFAGHRHAKKNPETLDLLGPIESFHDMHWHQEKGWTSTISEAQYNEMIEIRERQINQDVNASDSDSSNLPFMTDDEIMEHVLGYRSGYVKGLGALPR